MICNCTIAPGETSIDCHLRGRQMTRHMVGVCQAGKFPAPPPDPLACLHRGDAVGEIDCGCDSPETIYQCFSPAVVAANAPNSFAPVTRRKPAKRPPGQQLPNCLTCPHRAPIDLSRVTAAITEFKRPAALKRLIASIERYYPAMQIEVEPTGGNLSAARNRLYSRVDTPLVLVLEEDFEFTADTDLSRLLAVIDSDATILGAAGICLEKDRGRVSWKHDFHTNKREAWIAPTTSPGENVGGVGFKRCSLVLNFGIFRRKLFDRIGWDENLPIHEHWDYFYRVQQEMGPRRFAFVAGVSIEHHKDRPAGYSPYRNRRFDSYLRDKHGLIWLGGIGQRRDPIASVGGRPNVVLMGVGHSNTTITARQLGALGWSLVDADDRYAESISVRSINAQTLKNGVFPQQLARETLAGFPPPWAIKDPRFVRTLHHWRPLLQSQGAALIWLTKDLEEVAASHARRGESPDYIDAAYNQAAQQFAAWPGPKIQIDASQIAAASQLFEMKP